MFFKLFIFKKRKFISPIITIILLIIIALVIISILLNFGKLFVDNNLNNSNLNKNLENVDFTGFVFVDKAISSLEQNTIFIKNLSNTAFILKGYKIIDLNSTYSLNNKIIFLKEPIIINTGQIYNLDFPCFPNKKFELHLITTDNSFVKSSVDVSNYTQDKCLFNNNIISYWSLDKKHSKDKNILDISSNNNHGYSINDIDFRTDRFGELDSAINFDGVNLILTPNLNYNRDTFTISFWIKTNNIGTIYNTYWNTSKIQINLTYTGCYFIIRQSAHNVLNSYVSVIDNDWHHLVFIKDYNTMKIYTDGVFSASREGVLGVNPNSYRLEIGLGAQAPYKSEPEPSFIGLMDDFVVFDSALTSQEINYLYNIGIR